MEHHSRHVFQDWKGRRWSTDQVGLDAFRIQIEVEVQLGEYDDYDTAEGHTCVGGCLYECKSCMVYQARERIKQREYDRLGIKTHCYSRD